MEMMINLRPLHPLKKYRMAQNNSLKTVQLTVENSFRLNATFPNA